MLLLTLLLAHADAPELTVRFAGADTVGALRLLWQLEAPGPVLISSGVGGRVSGTFFGDLGSVGPQLRAELDLQDHGVNGWASFNAAHFAPDTARESLPDGWSRCEPEGALSVDLTHTPVRTVLHVLAKVSGHPIIAPQGTNGDVAVMAKAESTVSILGALARSRGLSLGCRGDAMVLWPRPQGEKAWDAFQRLALVALPDDDDALLQKALATPVLPLEASCPAWSVPEFDLQLDTHCAEPPPRPLLRDAVPQRAEGRSPLQSWRLTDLVLTAIATTPDGSYGLVEDPTGVSHVIEPGTYLGHKWARVTAVDTDAVDLVEEYTTLNGEVLSKPLRLVMP